MNNFSQVQSRRIHSRAEFEIVYDQPLVNELTVWDYPNHFFSYFKKESTKLVVMLQGAIDRTKMTLPVFQRWSWAEDIDASVLILNDPTLFGNTLKLGWWQGNEDLYAMSSACEFIKMVTDKLGYSLKDILLFGSSAGGFVSLMIAGQLKGSMAIVNNPQTNLLEYHEKHIQLLLQTKFRDMSKQEAFSLYPTRFSVMESFKAMQYIPKIVYYQNSKDSFHFEYHYLPFIQALYQSDIDPNEFQSILYTHSWGHTPLERVKTVSILNDWLAKLSASTQPMLLKEIPEVFEPINIPISISEQS